MKSIRNLVTLTGFFVVLFALGATATRAQSLATTNFAGTFTLPFMAQWGPVALQPGEYSLYYGRLYGGGPAVVEVAGKEDGTVHAFILAQSVRDASIKKSALLCIREGNAGIIRALEIPQLRQAVEFKMPRGAQLRAQKSNGNRNVEVAGGPMLLQRIPITLNK